MTDTLGSGMKRLGVFLTDEERLMATDAATHAARTPVISFGSGPDMASVAWRHAQEMVHRFALRHGLPEIPGYYGADLQTGELIESGGKVT
jgi:hypothetical protein